MPNVEKQLNQLSGHLAIIAVPIPNISSIEGPFLYCHNLDANFALGCSNESLSIATPVNHSSPGYALATKVTGFIRGRSQDNDTILESMLRYRFVVVLQNAGGDYTRLGSISKGLSFMYDYATSPNPDGAAGYSFSFEGATLAGQRPVNYPFNVKI